MRAKARVLSGKARSVRVSRPSPPQPPPEDSESPSSADERDDEPEAPAAKRRKVTKSTSITTEAYRRLLTQKDSLEAKQPCLAPARKHSLGYHKPLLLDGQFGRDNRDAFLKWFDSVSLTRAMPWRKAWINPRSTPASELRSALERRAYEVWISEIMLQQTRVAAVIEYWNRWMDKWPTIHDLAKASNDDVLAAWRGLGYYSRATRIHDAAKAAVADESMKGLLPETAAELESKVAGVGRYTAGAISSIVFGRPEPMVDGNVLRVLSRQLGIHGNIKTDKAVIDMIWAAADSLVKTVAKDTENETETETSDRPGRWGQGLMELGSTICTPKPNCAECPITATCRAYSEGTVYVSKKAASTVTDIEDLCTVCEPFIEEEEETPPPLQVSKKPAKQMTLAAFSFTKTSSSKPVADKAKSQAVDIEKVVDYAKRFPIKVAKKAVRQEETLVCAISRADGRYLIHRRPEKGLLAGLWEFPSHLLASNDLSPAKRKQLAKDHVKDLVGDKGVKYAADLGSVPWLFSHIKLAMHVHLFTLENGGDIDSKDKRWSDDVDSESMGTGMRKCWDLVREADSI